MHKREMPLIFVMLISCYKINRSVNNVVCTIVTLPTNTMRGQILVQSAVVGKTGYNRQERPRKRMNIHQSVLRLYH